MSFPALKADKEDANVEVIDNKGNKVATVATLLAEGATSAEFQFEKPFASDYKFEGVWKVDGKEFNFDLVNQLKDILDTAEAGNQIKFQAALDAAGVTYADEAKIADYLSAVADAEKTPEKIADVQALINKVDEEKTVAAEKTAAVKAVVSAKTQAALLKALQNNFKLVNPDWIVTYEADVKDLDLDADDVTDAEFAKIQKTIDDANIKEITKAAQVAPFADPTNTDLKAKTAAEQKVVTALIEKWHDEDDAEDKSDKVKANALKASKLAEAEFAITDAKTPTALYNALVAYVKAVDDESVIKADEVKVANKQGYWNVLEDSTTRATLLTDIQKGNADIKDTIINPGDENAENLATTAALDKLNKVTTSTTNAQVVEYLKAVQALTEDSTKVVDANAEAYKAAVVEALTPTGDPAAVTPLTKETTNQLVADVNNTEAAKAFADEYKAILTKTTVTAEDLKAAVAANAAYTKLDTDVKTAYEALVSDSSNTLKATADQLTDAQAAFYTAYAALTKEADVVKAIDELDNKFFAKLTDAQKLEVAALVQEDATVNSFETLSTAVTTQTSFYKEVLNSINGAEKLADLQGILYTSGAVTDIGEAVGATATNYKLVADAIFSGKPAAGYTTLAEITAQYK
ncbi:hypothetical protein [Rummeliibacillus sp. POC4]|uniref:hypothetical protein n=1 Tax=Rummeliibacillus sp. POC4 TaxID=2305899 RepID=UPI000E6742A9|nr:hypothetical protein [Rummeliibacillus sp. POC4]RIJ69379.1 hypothetical protein D1606_01035 [Rummeliibacillus sp. POC4]